MAVSSTETATDTAGHVPVTASVGQTCRRSRYQGGIARLEEYLEREDQQADDQAEITVRASGQPASPARRPATKPQNPSEAPSRKMTA